MIVDATARRVAAVVACFLASVAALLWIGIPAPWLLLLAVVHGPVLVLRPRFAPALLAADVGLIAWRSYAIAPIYFGHNFDTWMHLAIVRRVVENGPFPPDPYYAGYGAAPILSLVHQLYGAAALLTGQPIAQVWIWGIPVVVMLIGAVAYFLHRELLGDPTAAFFAAMFHLVSRFFELPHANYPRVVGPMFFMLSLALMLRGLRTSRRLMLAMAGLALGLAIAAHPITGVMSTMVVASVLLGEWALEGREGRGRAFVPMALALIGGAAVTAGPWIAYDFAALLNLGEPAPLLYGDWGDLSFFLRINLSRALRSGMPLGDPVSGWTVLWGLPVLLGVVRLFAADCERRIRVYVAATAAVALIAIWSPFTHLFVELFAPRYVARFFSVLPFPALAGFGLTFVFRKLKGRGPRLAAATAFTLYAALLLRSGEPATSYGIEHPPWQLDRPELAELEPLLRDRVVLTTRASAYVLPHFTGAYVVLNYQKHSNPWAWDRERVRGARRILKGKEGPAAIRAFCERYEVDFALLGKGSKKVLRSLLASGEFHRRLEVPGYVLLERRVPAK